MIHSNSPIKLLLLILFGGILVPKTKSQEYRMIGVYPNGESVIENDIFLLNSNASFSLVDKSGNRLELKSAYWQLSGFKKEKVISAKLLYTGSLINGSSFDFKVDTSLIKTNNLIDLSPFKLLNDSSNYYHAVITVFGYLPNNKKILFSIPIRLNLLPSTPKISIEESNIIPNSDEMSLIRLKITTSNPYDNNYSNYVYSISYDEEGQYTSTSYPIGNSETTFFDIEFPTTLGYDHSIFDDFLMGPGRFLYDTFHVISRNVFGNALSDMIPIDMEFIKRVQKNNVNTSSQQKKGKENIIIYPNPATDLLYINGEDISKIQSITLFNSEGKFSKTLPLSNNYIDIADLPAGIYIITFNYPQKIRIHSSKIILKK